MCWHAPVNWFPLQASIVIVIVCEKKNIIWSQNNKKENVVNRNEWKKPTRFMLVSCWFCQTVSTDWFRSIFTIVDGIEYEQFTLPFVNSLTHIKSNRRNVSNQKFILYNECLTLALSLSLLPFLYCILLEYLFYLYTIYTLAQLINNFAFCYLLVSKNFTI